MNSKSGGPVPEFAGEAPAVDEDVRWFEKSFLLNRKNESERINLPRKVSIARQLLDGWLGEGD